MKIRKRLAISNTVMFIVPIILIVLIASVVLETFTEVYRSQLIGYQKEFFNGVEGFEKAVETMLSDMKILVVNYLGIILLSAIVIIVLMNSFLASRVTKSILVPLDLLSYGSNQIKEGNLDFKLDYRGKDEFQQVFSDFNEMRQRLKDSVEMELRYETDKRELVAGISHDLRTPLTVIKGYVEGLRDGIANTPEKQQVYLDMIYRKACDMDSLVDNLFLFSRMDTGHYPFDFRIVEIKDFLTEFFDRAGEEFSRKGLDISFETGESGGIYVKLDRKEMGRVLINVLENSLKYKIRETGRITAGLKRSGRAAVITIADDGPGVPREELPKLFARFYRGDPSRTNPQEGSGLGLAIAKHIVNSHEGTIMARSRGGLEITITLPVKTREEYEADTDH